MLQQIGFPEGNKHNYKLLLHTEHKEAYLGRKVQMYRIKDHIVFT